MSQLVAYLMHCYVSIFHAMSPALHAATTPREAISSAKLRLLGRQWLRQISAHQRAAVPRPAWRTWTSFLSHPNYFLERCLRQSA
mmetsp:Transcript_57137/g.105652  ORF Transcript_57137/g.105652 Transcript_57137/m.105652 type:complete len:85 (-) Transcript_57137:8-262(-)